MKENTKEPSAIQSERIAYLNLYREKAKIIIPHAVYSAIKSKAVRIFSNTKLTATFSEKRLTKNNTRRNKVDKSAVTKAKSDKNIVVLLLIKYLKIIIYYIVA